MDASVIADYFVRGLVPNEKCKLDVKVGWVKGKIVDKLGNSTPEARFKAYLALTDNILLIVGFKDLLERYHIDINPVTGKVFVESK